ncbi:hypothetical protein [Francisella tularensis]|uniref:hypothetical protein n=1 Tax=Francisella tularensis TaxID=263 RepID=UPI00056F5AA2
MKYKKLLLTALMTACGATSYATAVDYKAGSAYQQHQSIIRLDLAMYVTSQDGALLQQLGLMSLAKVQHGKKLGQKDVKTLVLVHNL